MQGGVADDEDNVVLLFDDTTNCLDTPQAILLTSWPQGPPKHVCCSIGQVVRGSKGKNRS